MRLHQGSQHVFPYNFSTTWWGGMCFLHVCMPSKCKGVMLRRQMIANDSYTPFGVPWCLSSSVLLQQLSSSGTRQLTILPAIHTGIWGPEFSVLFYCSSCSRQLCPYLPAFSFSRSLFFHQQSSVIDLNAISVMLQMPTNGFSASSSVIEGFHYSKDHVTETLSHICVF